MTSYRPRPRDMLFISRELERSTSAKVRARKAPHVSTFLGKAGSIGFEVLDSLGSSISNLNSYGRFVPNMASRQDKVFIMALEVANTIVKGLNLMQSLSKENIQIFKKEILQSEGVQLLVSTDMKELLSIAADDKREELEVFKREVVRFGDMCKDPQWHHLDRYFVGADYIKNGIQREINKPSSNLKKNKKKWFDPLFSFSQTKGSMNWYLSPVTMQELANLAQHTSELYHESETLDRLQRYYCCKLEEMDSSPLPLQGESLVILQSELRNQRKLVRNLKKKSLWSKSLEEVVEKLVDVVTFIHQAIPDALEENVSATSSTMNGKEANKEPERLGDTGLALHYANLITQIRSIASRPTSLTPNMRDTLYNGLPASVKADLRSCLQALDSPKVMTVPQIKAEMDKTLNWLVPLATDTIKAHHGFGFVGEWTNIGNEFGTKTAASNNIIRLQTLYHANKHTMDLYILDLIILINRLISLTRYKDDVSPTSKGLNLHPDGKLERIQISLEDKNLLEKVPKQRMLVPGVSISQDQVLVKKKKKKKKRAEVFASGRSIERI